MPDSATFKDQLATDTHPVMMQGAQLVRGGTCGNPEAWRLPSSSAAPCTRVAEAAALRPAHCVVHHMPAQLVSPSNPSPSTWFLKVLFLHHLSAAGSIWEGKRLEVLSSPLPFLCRSESVFAF